MKMLKIKTNIFVIFLISTILLIAQPSNCFDSYHDLEADDIYHDILGLNPDAVPTDPFDQPTFFSEHDYGAQHDCGESYDALPPLPFESIQADPDAPEYLFDRNRFRLADSAPLPLQKLSATLPHFDFATQQPSTAAVATSSLMLSSSRKWPRENAYQCDQCTKTYRYSCRLAEHIRTFHNKERPYQCKYPECTKTYANKTRLTTHIRTFHNNERRYKCKHPECTKAYIGKSGLELHMRDFHKIFACTITGCTLSFLNKATLASHKTIVHKKALEPAPAISKELAVEPDNYTDKSNL